MRHMGVMAMLLIGAAALPAASMVSGFADFPGRDEADLPFKGGHAGIRVARFAAALALDIYDGSPKTKPSKGGKTAHRYLAPVRNPAKVAIKATAIIEATRLVLLRSSSGSDQRRIACEQVAAVVDSNKVLLRSS